MSPTITPDGLESGVDPRIQRLLGDAATDEAAADQLATDASRLAGLSKERLKEFQGAGFFVRFWCRVSGKTAALERATVADLVAAQDLAWQYLDALQKQGLFSARAIVVVRNNLAHVAGSHERLGSLVLAQAVKLGRLAQDVRIIDWREGLKVRADYAALPELLRVLKAAFEYAEKFDDHGDAVERLEASHDLDIALSNLGVSATRQMTLGEMADELARHAVESGAEPFTALASIRIDGQRLEPGQLSGLVAGRAFACIFDLAREIPLALRVTQSAVPQMRLDLVRNAARAVVAERDAGYDLISLSREIVAATAMVRALLKPADETAARTPVQPATRRLSVEELLAQHVPLGSHALSGLDLPRSLLQHYVDSLMLVAAQEELDATQRSFLSSLGRVLPADSSEPRAREVLADPGSFRLAGLLELLSSRERKFAWILDAVFLGSAAGRLDPTVRSRILQMAQVFDLKNDEAGKLLDLAQVIATSTQPAEIAKAVVSLWRDTSEWKTILDFRKVSLTGAFSAFGARRWADLRVELGLMSELGQMMSDVCMSWMSFGDENFLAGLAISIGRKTSNSSFDALAKKVQTYSESAGRDISEANGYLRAFGHEPVEVPATGSASAFRPDTQTDGRNDAWNDNMQRSLDGLSAHFHAHMDALSLCDDRLMKIAAGRWN